jgi:hypothetical protein
VLTARKVMKSGRRISVEGQHLLTIETIHERVKNAETMIVEKKKKSSGKGRAKSNCMEVISSEDETDKDVYDSIEVVLYQS